MEHSEEILTVKFVEYSSPSWARSVLFHDQVGEGKIMCLCDSVLRVGRVKDISGAIERWRSQVEDLKRYSSYQDTVGLDGEAIEFERKVFPGFSSSSLLREIQKDLERKHIQPEELKDRITFTSMFNDIEWKKTDENCISNAEKVKNCAMKILARTSDILGSRVGREVVWKFFLRSKRRMGLYNPQNGTAVQRNWSSCVQKYQCQPHTSMEVR